MALSGDLRFVPLDEVLRLLARAGQKGSIEVSGADVSGRILVAKEGIVIATVVEDQDLRQHLINSHFVDDAYLERVESGQKDFGPLADKGSGLMDVLREITVESIYQMSEHGSTFEVRRDASSPYGAPEPFELEGILDDVRKRGAEWAAVAGIVSDLEGIIKVNPNLGDRHEVIISSDAWKLLSELGSGSSVSTMAARLGTTVFWTARLAAEMAASELLIIGDQAPDGEAGRPEDEIAVPTREASAGEVEAHEGRIESAKSWWVAESGAPEEVAASDDRSVDTHADTYDEVEEDTEAFLEKVFSELDSQETPEAERHRIGRRRRFGSMLDDQPDND